MSSAAGNNLQINPVVGANQYDEANESPKRLPAMGAREQL